MKRTRRLIVLLEPLSTEEVPAAELVEDLEEVTVRDIVAYLEEVPIHRKAVLAAYGVGDRSRIAITDDGERIPPTPGDPPCGEYEEAGPGAGVEGDGHPQCASCGHPRSLHEVKPCDECGGLGYRAEWNGETSPCDPCKGSGRAS